MLLRRGTIQVPYVQRIPAAVRLAAAVIRVNLPAMEPVVSGILTQLVRRIRLLRKIAPTAWMMTVMV